VTTQAHEHAHPKTATIHVIRSNLVRDPDVNSFGKLFGRNLLGGAVLVECAPNRMRP
jgi:hypothetical protein